VNYPICTTFERFLLAAMLGTTVALFAGWAQAAEAEPQPEVTCREVQRCQWRDLQQGRAGERVLVCEPTLVCEAG
jgi:hypothetical protein